MMTAAVVPPLSTPPAAPHQGRGEPPDCSKIRALGPPSPKAAAHRPMVWGSLSRASAVAEAVQPWANSPDGLPALPLPRRGRQNRPPVHILDIHLPPFEKPVYFPHTHHHTPRDPRDRLTQLPHQFTPCVCAFHLGFGLEFLTKEENALSRYPARAPRALP